ncbi:hypothetical protein D1O30_06800 [Methylocystis hirsuta]|uniref:Uncharacterized protein n=1 Tax=Methylocystis hirsuta TaxID=369798 RepID=A0A3M9XM42_9HYPH|nr:hypothetical protein D1O30_06800 [Methylocystis hirsuta]
MVPEGQPYVIVDSAQLPQADPSVWRLVDGVVVVDSDAPGVDFANNFHAVRASLVTHAYGGVEKRTSLYGYLAQLGAEQMLGPLSIDKQHDLNLLLAAARWEQQMLDAVDGILVDGAITDASWPVFAQAADLAELAAKS